MSVDNDLEGSCVLDIAKAKELYDFIFPSASR